MSAREWPPVVSLLPGPCGLDSNVVPSRTYEQLANVCPLRAPLLVTDDLVEQEHQLVRDVFRVLAGGEGTFIRYVETFDPVLLDDRLAGPRYRLHGPIDRGFKDLVVRIVDVASRAFTVRTYADHFAGLEYGRVNQALAAALRVLHRLYLEIVAELESIQFARSHMLNEILRRLEPFWPHLDNVQRLVQRFIEETRLVRDRKRQGVHDDLVARASTAQFVAHGEKEATIELRGGAVLRTIATQLRLELGNAAAANLYGELLAAASQPYLEMLQKWLCAGEIDDPQDEFLVQETRAYNPLISGQQSVDDYWDKRYTIRAIDLPLQLSAQHLYDRLLVAGKYLNVIRDTTGKLEIPPSIDLTQCTSVEDPRVADAVLQTYQFANLALLELFKTSEHDLKWLLRSLRKVFFLTESDAFSAFLDAAGDTLAEPASAASLEQLELLLVHTSGSDDAVSEHLGLSLAAESLRDAMLRIVANSSSYETPRSAPTASLSTLDALQLTFEVPFPLSLVVPRRSIVRYQFLFRHLLDIVVAQRALTHAWELQMLAPQWRVTGGDAGRWKHRAHILRQRQLLFANELLYHCTQDGIYRGWAELYESLDSFEEVSELVDRHISFLDRCLVNCYLAHPQLLRFQTRLLALSRQYGHFLRVNLQLVEYMASDPVETVLDAEGNVLKPEDLLQWFASHVERYENSFDRNLRRYYEQLAAFVPTNFVAGGSTAALMQRLATLLPEGAPGSAAGVPAREPMLEDEVPHPPHMAAVEMAAAERETEDYQYDVS